MPLTISVLEPLPPLLFPPSVLVAAVAAHPARTSMQASAHKPLARTNILIIAVRFPSHTTRIVTTVSSEEYARSG
jgi:hypothetical protein